MRLFFAVLLPEHVLEAIANTQAILRTEAGHEGIRWTRAEQFHYTLKFLGETPEDRLALVTEAAEKVAAQTASFTLAPAGIGAFPQKRSPQTLWVGIEEGVPHLTRLAELLDRSLAEHGFPPETRRFDPHLTLARVKTPAGCKAVARALAARAVNQKKVDRFEVIGVESFVLMNSELHPAGSIYTVLRTFTL